MSALPAAAAAAGSDMSSESEEAAVGRGKRRRRVRPPEFACPKCARMFYKQAHLRAHDNVVHHGVHKFPCTVCGKGHNSARRLQAHLATHTLPQRAQQPLARILHTGFERLCLNLMELRRQMRPASCTSDEACQIAAAERNDDSLCFECQVCQQRWHWACVGYPVIESLETLVLVCPVCLTKAGLLKTALLRSLSDGAVLTEYLARELGKEAVAVRADGWCLVRCVALALGREDDLCALLREALAVVPTLPSLAALPVEDRTQIEADCAVMRHAANATLTRRMRRQWDSLVVDHLPEAFATLLQRPVQILQFEHGMLHVTEVKPLLATADAVPLLLMRVLADIGYPHYALVR